MKANQSLPHSPHKKNSGKVLSLNFYPKILPDTPSDYALKVNVKIFDAAAIVNIIKPTCVKFFKDYAFSNFLPFIKKDLQDVKRVDIVWDQCKADSLEEQTRTDCGQGVRHRISDKTAIAKDCMGCLSTKQWK